MAFYVETLSNGLPIARWDKPLRTGADFEAMYRELAEQQAARQPEEPITRTTLTDWEITQLAEKYPRGSLSQEQYDGLLEELVDRGVLTQNEIEHMGYKGMVYFPLNIHGSCAYQIDEDGIPLTDAYGNSMSWARRLAEYLPKGVTAEGASVLPFAANHRDAFNALDAIFARMDRARSPWPVPAQ